MPTDNFPNTSWPADIDVVQDRTNTVDYVDEDDFDYNADQFNAIQKWLGSLATGRIIGDNGNASEGPTGLASPVADGGVAFTLVAKNSFSSGDILSVGENLASYNELMSLDHDGLLWANGGVDAGALLLIPNAAVGAAGTAGRLQWDPTAPGLKFDNGAAWVDVGAGAAGSYLEFANGFTQTQGLSTLEETVGQGVLDGDIIPGSFTAYFRCVVTPTLTSGNVLIKLYDMGPKAGPPASPRLVTTLTATTSVIQTLEQSLTVVAATPTTNQILDTPRMYEATLEVNGVTADSAYLGIVGIEVR